MKVNRFRPHLLILPEDDANRQIANGFLLEPSLLDQNVSIVEEAGGWREVVTRFQKVYEPEMAQYQNRFMVLLIDFDHHLDRLQEIRQEIPAHLKDRVFILGTLSEPERLKPDLGSFEKIGLKLARECFDGTQETWSHTLLRHNMDELQRLRISVRAILFEAN